MGITTASHTRPSETKWCWDMADFHIQHQFEHWGCSRGAKWNTHQGKLAAWTHVLVVCIRMCVQCTYMGISIFIVIEHSFWVVCFSPSMPVVDVSGCKWGLIPKEAVVRPIFLFLLPLHFSFFCLPLSLQPKLKTWHYNRPLDEANLYPSPFFLSHSHILFHFFFFMWVPENISKQTQLANDSGLANGWS